MIVLIAGSISSTVQTAYPQKVNATRALSLLNRSLFISNKRRVNCKQKHMQNETDYWTIKAMKMYGGTFVQQLAVLAELADSQNLLKIKETWKNYWHEYGIAAEKLKAESKDI